MPRYRTEKILLKVSRAVSSSLDLETVSDLILKESTDALAADHASLFLMDESGRLILTRVRGFSEDETDNIKLLGSWEVINNYLIKRKRPLIVNNIQRDPIFKDKNVPFLNEKMPIQSFLAVPLEKDNAIVGVLIISNRKRPGHSFTARDEELLLALSNYVAIALSNAKLYKRLKDLFLSTVVSLTKAIDAKDKYTSGHSERVMHYAVAIGKEMGLSAGALENLRLSGVLHDVGKIGIKESILSKPAKLLGYERNQIKRHPAIGASIVGTIEDSHKIIRGILEHHERFDGKGYPNQLKGSAISLDGRIIAVADTFDALTTNRPYQKGYSHKEAIFEIHKGTGTQFDPRVVKAFIKSFSKRPDIWK